MLDALAADPDVQAVSANAVVTGNMAQTTITTGAVAAWTGQVASLGAVDGSGIGVAIVDSGISPHCALAGKVVVSVDFTRNRNRGRGLDGYGHGTHIGRHRRRREVRSARGRPARPAWRLART